MVSFKVMGMAPYGDAAKVNDFLAGLGQVRERRADYHPIMQRDRFSAATRKTA